MVFIVASVAVVSVCLRVSVCVCVCGLPLCTNSSYRVVAATTLVSSLYLCLSLTLSLSLARCTQHHHRFSLSLSPLTAATLLALNSLIFEAFVMNLFSCLILVIYLLWALFSLFLQALSPSQRTHIHTHILRKCGSFSRSIPSVFDLKQNLHICYAFCIFLLSLSPSFSLFVKRKQFLSIS